jgi:ABC-type uncharacterized transport system involved in gliding motility auxiliary subunit
VRREKIVFASSATAGIVLAAALLGMVNWLGYRHYLRGDWTASHLYSLSQKTKNVLKGVKDEVRVVVLMTPTTPLFGETKELLSRYEALSPKLKVEFIDPERDPLRTRQLAQEFGVSAANTVVFSADGRKKYVTSDQLADYDYSGMQMGQGPKLKGFKGEEQFTSAILGVVSPKVPKAYFSTGHGEHGLDAADGDGYSQFKEVLKRDNLDVQTATLLAGSVPADCDLLVIAGPKVPFTEQEKAALKTYLEKGGRAMILLDPVIGQQQRPSGLEDFLKAYGVQVNNDIVVDPEKQLPFFSLAAVYANEFRSHPVVDPMQGLAVLLPVARSVTTTMAPGAASTILLTTSPQGWGVTDIAAVAAGKPVSKGPKDTQGPVSLGVAAQSETDKDKGWRLVVFGNSLFAANQYLANAGNVNLGLNAAAWLAKQEQALGIAPRAPEQVQLFLSASQMRTVFLLSLVVLPGLAIVMGVTVWWRRRR